jgi:serine/threonine protein kinase
MGANMEIGQVIKGALRIEDIKQGGMGIVYICKKIVRPRPGWLEDVGDKSEDTRDDEASRVALKSMDSRLFLSGRNQALFTQEALIWTSLLPHPYIISCQSVDSIQTAPAIMLEYAGGGNLRDRISSQQITLGDTLRLSREVCTGMQFLAASGGILHRDLKPENILFSESGDAKVTDFGLASLQRIGLGLLLGGDPSQPELSAEAVIGGTLPYMSPEHFGVGDFTTAADIYSFGVVMYEALEGRLPFDCSSVAAFREAHLSKKPPRLSRSHGPAKLGALIAKCMEKEPAHRFQDFAELDEALLEIISGERLDVPPPLKPTMEELESKITSGEWGNRGYAFAQLSRYEDSLRCYQRAYELSPEEFGSNMNLATGLGRVGRDEEALLHYQREVELHPGVALAHQGLGHAYAARERWDEAAEELSTAVRIEPDPAMMRDLIALYRRLDRDADSDRIIEQLFEYMENNTGMLGDSWVNEGLHLGLIGEYDASLRMFETCIRLYPENADGWYNRAVTLFMLGEINQAFESLVEALHVGGDLPQTHFFLGLIFLLADETERARDRWSHLVREDSGHHFGQIASSAIELLGIAPGPDVAELILRSMDIPNDLYYR